MKNFDEERDARRDADREFQLGGELFVRVTGIRPEQLYEYDDLQPGAPSEKVIEVMDKTLIEFLEDDAEGTAAARYRKLREQKEHPITLGDIVAVVKWLVSEATGHPTVADESSLRGPDSTERSSAAQGSSRGQLRTI